MSLAIVAIFQRCRWSRRAIRQFVDLEVDAFARLRRIPINESESRLIADALTKELAGLGPLEDLLSDPENMFCCCRRHHGWIHQEHPALARELGLLRDEQMIDIDPNSK